MGNKLQITNYNVEIDGKLEIINYNVKMMDEVIL